MLGKTEATVVGKQSIQKEPHHFGNHFGDRHGRTIQCSSIPVKVPDSMMLLGTLTGIRVTYLLYCNSPLIEVGNAVRADCYSTASYP